MIVTIVLLILSWLSSLVQGFAVTGSPLRRSGGSQGCDSHSLFSSVTTPTETAAAAAAAAATTSGDERYGNKDAAATTSEGDDDESHHLKYFMQYVGMNHVPKENDSNDFSTTATTTTTIGNNPTGDLSNNDDEHKLHELHQKQGHIVSAAATGFFLAAEAGASAPVSAVAGAALMAYMAANGGDSLLEALPHHLQAPMQHVIDSFHRSNPFFGNHNHNHNHNNQERTEEAGNSVEEEQEDRHQQQLAQAWEKLVHSLEGSFKHIPENEPTTTPIQHNHDTKTPHIHVPKSSFAAVRHPSAVVQDETVAPPQASEKLVHSLEESFKLIPENEISEAVVSTEEPIHRGNASPFTTSIPHIHVPKSSFASVPHDDDDIDDDDDDDDSASSNLVVGSPAWVAAQTRMRDRRRRHAQESILTRGVLEHWPQLRSNNQESFAWWD